MALYGRKLDRPGARRARDKVVQRGERGFTLIELMIAVALLTVMMAAAFTAVFEVERSANTVVARTTDAASAEPVVNSLARQVRAAEQAALSDATAGSDPYTELWLASASTSDWPYTCTVWAYEQSTHELDAFATSSSLAITQTSPGDLALDASDGTDGLHVAAQLQGVSPMASGSGGLFQDFAGYPGLVDISLQLRYSTTASQSSTQQGTATPVMVEVEADDANVLSPPSGLAPFSTISPYYPSSSCY